MFKHDSLVGAYIVHVKHYIVYAWFMRSYKLKRLTEMDDRYNIFKNICKYIQ